MTEDSNNDTSDEESAEEKWPDIDLSERPPPPPKGNDRAVGNRGGAPPEGNDNAVGNSGGRPPVNNQNGAKHYLHSDPDKVLPWLEEHEPEAYEWVIAKYAGYLEDAPFDGESAKADQLKQICVREFAIWKASGIQIREGILKQTHIKGSDGELVEVTKEHPVNKPLDRMESQITKRLKELGVLDDPDTQAAAAIAEGNEYYEVVDVEAETVEDDGG